MNPSLMEYQVRANETAFPYREACSTISEDPQNSLRMLQLSYATIGLCAEAGEFANKAKKVIRDTQGELTEEARDALSKELGGVLWYFAACCTELGLNASEVAMNNLRQLDERQKAGTLTGSGDDR